MFSSKVQDIPQGNGDAVEDIASKTQVVASGATDDANEAFEKMGGRVQQEGGAIKTAIEAVLGTVYDLLKSEEGREMRRQARQRVNKLSNRVVAWAESREDEIVRAVRSGGQGRRHRRREKPMLSLLIAAGTGALVAYWLTHRSSMSDKSIIPQ